MPASFAVLVFLALYDITQESSGATRIAARTGRHPQTVIGWLHAYNAHGPAGLVYRRTGGRPPLPPPTDRPRRGHPPGPAHRCNSARSRRWAGAPLDAQAPGRLGARAVRPNLLPRDDPCCSAAPEAELEEGQEAARSGRPGATAGVCRAAAECLATPARPQLWSIG